MDDNKKLIFIFIKNQQSNSIFINCIFEFGKN